MPVKGIYLDHRGPVDYDIINGLLESLKESEAYRALNKPTAKRLYCVLNECLENMARHSVREKPADPGFLPYISSRQEDNKIMVRSGNPVLNGQQEILERKLIQINEMDDESLTVLYDETINKETQPGKNGAGLGLILMKLKSGNRIDYNFTRIDRKTSFFEIKILINRFIMRKLVIEKTASSPKVILDPERNEFEISGESRPANVGAFYGEILRWVDDYSLNLLKSQENSQPVVFNFDLEYFNSSSAKYILDLCKQFASVRSRGKHVEVVWKYEEDDIDMLEAGKEMSRIAKMPFEYLKK